VNQLIDEEKKRMNDNNWGGTRGWMKKNKE
jgi:hypothetical protein